MEIKVYVAETLVENVDSNSCSTEVFPTIEEARKFANEEIDSYAADYTDGVVTERADNYYAMQSGDNYVTIEIVEKILKVNLEIN